MPLRLFARKRPIAIAAYHGFRNERHVELTTRILRRPPEPRAAPSKAAKFLYLLRLYASHEVSGVRVRLRTCARGRARPSARGCAGGWVRGRVAGESMARTSQLLQQRQQRLDRARRHRRARRLRPRHAHVQQRQQRAQLQRRALPGRLGGRRLAQSRHQLARKLVGAQRSVGRIQERSDASPARR